MRLMDSCFNAGPHAPGVLIAVRFGIRLDTMLMTFLRGSVGVPTAHQTDVHHSLPLARAPDLQNTSCTNVAIEYCRDAVTDQPGHVASPTRDDLDQGPTEAPPRDVRF